MNKKSKKRTILSRVRFHNLKAQLILSFMIVSLIVLILNSWITYKTNISMLEDISKNNTVQTFRQLEQNMNDFISEIDNMTKILLTNKVIDDYLGDESNSELTRTYLFTDLSSITSNYFAFYNQIESILVVKNKEDLMGFSRSRSWNIRNSLDPSINFFNTEKYSHLYDSFPRMNLFGNTSTNDFINEKDINFYKNKEYNFITVARGILPQYKTRQPAVLLVNIYESSLKKVYRRMAGSNNSIFIIDQAGTIISHPDTNRIGEEIPEFHLFDKTQKDGSITYKSEGKVEKIVYYKLDRTGWFVVNKIPFSEFEKNTVRMQRVTMIVLLSSLLIILILYTTWLSRIMVPFFELVKVMKKVQEGNLGVVVSGEPRNEIGTVIAQFNRLSVSIKELVENNRIMEEQKRKLEIEFLQSQINPHFLYNTLNAIKWMAAIIKAKKIVESITILGNLIRPIFNQADIFCTLSEEIEYTENFMKIMCYRYDEAIELTTEVSDGLVESRVLRFLLQPLVENSFIHGFKGMIGNKKIKISVYRENDRLVIAVNDNGQGIPESVVEELNRDFSRSVFEDIRLESGIGIRNVNKRIKLHYGNEYGIEILKITTDGTSILVKLPLQTDK